MSALPGAVLWVELLESYSNGNKEFIGLLDEEAKKLVWLNEFGATLFGYQNAAAALEPDAEQYISSQFPTRPDLAQNKSFKKMDGSSFAAQSNQFPLSQDGRRYQVVRIAPGRIIYSNNEVAREKERFKALFNYATLGILVANREGNMVLSNGFAATQFGYAEGEMNGKKIEDLIPTRYRDRHSTYRQGFNQAPRPRSMGTGLNLMALKKDGTEFPVEISLSNYQNDEGFFVIAFIIDVTRRKQIEDDLRHQREEIEQLNNDLERKVELRTTELQEALTRLQESEGELTRALSQEKELSEMKSRFVSMASHEFRTPLSTILSSASLLAKYTETSEQEKRDKHIHRIKSSVNNLTDILNEFLSIGRIEDGKIVANFAPFNIRENMESVCLEMQSHVKPGQLISYTHEGPETVTLDPSLLRNIIINLLSNAIKFSPENGIIKVSSHVNGQVALSVKDNGIGIHPADQEHLFERFFRASNAINIQGTGLGLHIVGKYIELMNGQISFKSELEKGTEFNITFGTH